MNRLSQAIELSDESLVREILKSAVAGELDDVDDTNLTPLAHAVDVLADAFVQDGIELSTSIVEMLLAAGADPLAGSTPERSAIALARRSEHSGLKRILR